MGETKGEPDFEVDDMPFAIISFEAEKSRALHQQKQGRISPICQIAGTLFI